MKENVLKMTFLGRLLSKFSTKRREAKITLLGPSGAGKTTLVKYLETGRPVEENPKTTLGIDIRRTPIKIDGWIFRAIDIGGQELYQKTFWALGVEQADAVIFVIDGTVRPREGDDKWEQSLFQFEYALQLVDFSVPLLVIVNKQDLKELNPLTPEEAIQLYGIYKLAGRSLAVLPTSAKYGDGVQAALEWLVEKLREKENV